MEISPEPRVQGQLPYLREGMVRKGMAGRSWRGLGGVGLTNYEKALSPGSLRPLMWPLCINHQEFPFHTLLSHQRGNRCRGILGEGRTGDLTTLGPSSGYQHSQWFPWGVTYLIKTRQVTQMGYASLYKHLALLTVTLYSCVSMWPKHTFLHQMYRNPIRTISTPDQFTHMLPSAV